MNKLIIVILLLTLCISCRETKTSNELPNIILIIADDLGYADMGAANLASDVNTPNIDRIAKNGIRFSEAYDNSPICNQSRAAIITGCYPQRLGSYWYSAEGLHDERFITIPELLKEKDYKTGYVGKIHYGKNDSDILNRSFPTNHGFDYFFGHTSARKHYMNHKKEIEDSFLKVKKDNNKSGQSLRQGSLWENTNRVDTVEFLTTLIGNKSQEFIEKNKSTPFFLQVAFNAAHNFTHQLPKEYLKENNLKGYHDWDPAKEDYYPWYQKGRFPNNDEGRSHYLGQVKYMDEQIGAILNQLEQDGILDNTLIFFISDNGGSTPIYSNNTPLRGSKYILYEGGIRTHLLVSYPKKFNGGKVYDNMISAMDILPTICEETNINIPSHIDGMSLLPILSGEDKTIEHEVLFWDTGHELAIRKGDWKLRKAFKDDHAQYEMVDLELGEFLYDLNKDVGEKVNLIDSNKILVNELEKLHLTWKKEITDANKTQKIHIK